MADTPCFCTKPSELNFRILHMWWRQNPSIDHKEKLRVVFKDMDQLHLIDEMENFSRIEYIYRASKIWEPERFINFADITTVASNLAFMFYHVVRFLGLKQTTIDQIESNCGTIKERIIECLQVISQQKRVTRQSLCDALYYAGHCDVIEILNEKWETLVS